MEYANFTLAKGDTFSFSSEEAKDVVFGAAGTMKAVEGTVLSDNDNKGKSAWFCIDKNYVTSTKANSLTLLSPEETVTTTTMTTDKKLTDIKGDNWFKVENNRYVKESDGVEVSKYDLAKLGYRMIEDNNDSYSDDPRQMPKFFKALLKEIDTNQDGELSPAEIKQAYKTPEIRSQLEKLIVKNESEWHEGGRVQTLYERFLNLFKTEEQRNVVNHEMTRINELEFMSKVSMPSEVWHMNPLMVNIFNSQTSLITLEMLQAASSNLGNEYLNSILPSLNRLADAYKINTPLRIAHFLAQIGHESNFEPVRESGYYSPRRMREIFGCKGGSKNYNENTDNCNLGRLRDKLWTHESTYAYNPENLLNYAYANRTDLNNGDENSGDGYKYRGRGLIQLTGRDNYTNYTDDYNQRFPDEPKDFVNFPDLVIDDISCAMGSAFFYWNRNNLNSYADDDNIEKLTKRINGGDNGLNHRKSILKNLKELLGI